MSFTGRDDEYLESTVDNIVFFPSLSLGDFQRIYRVPVERDPQGVEHQLKVARNVINDQLTEQIEAWVEAGHADLAAVDAADETDLQTYYLDAVYCQAKAALLEDFQTFTRRANAEDIAKEDDDTQHKLFARINRNVRRLQGISENLTAELL